MTPGDEHDDDHDDHDDEDDDGGEKMWWCAGSQHQGLEKSTPVVWRRLASVVAVLV